jgi:hypothetical protein
LNVLDAFKNISNAEEYDVITPDFIDQYYKHMMVRYAMENKAVDIEDYVEHCITEPSNSFEKDAGRRFLNIDANRAKIVRLQNSININKENVKDYLDYQRNVWIKTSLILREYEKFKQVYKFDKDFYEVLKDTNMKEFDPDIFENIPFSGFYIDISDTKVKYEETGAYIVGMFVKVYMLFKQWFVETAYYSDDNSAYWTRDVWNIHEKQLISSGMDENYLLPDDLNNARINLITYICSENADIEKEIKHSTKKYNKKITNYTTWNTGYRIGSKIRKNKIQYVSESNTTGGTLRPHVRAAHWHRYWVGSGDDKHIVIKWIHEIYVKCNNADDLPAVEHN